MLVFVDVGMFRFTCVKAEALPAANQLVRSYLHPRIKDQRNGKKCGNLLRLMAICCV